MTARHDQPKDCLSAVKIWRWLMVSYEVDGQCLYIQGPTSWFSTTALCTRGVHGSDFTDLCRQLSSDTANK